MTSARQRLVTVLAVMAAVQAVAFQEAWADPPALSPAGLPLDAVTVKTQAGETLQFQVELAVTPSDQQRGLMFRTEMAEDAGMLFVFDPVRPVSFWMRNTLIPLDMLFIAPDGTILNIEANAEPETDTPRPSAGPVRGVLEINGGLAALLGIAAGDRVDHDAFGDPGDADPAGDG